MSDKQLKTLEESVAYLTKAIEELIKDKPIEIHTHYYYDYDSIRYLLDKYITDNNPN